MNLPETEIGRMCNNAWEIGGEKGVAELALENLDWFKPQREPEEPHQLRIFKGFSDEEKFAYERKNPNWKEVYKVDEWEFKKQRVASENTSNLVYLLKMEMLVDDPKPVRDLLSEYMHVPLIKISRDVTGFLKTYKDSTQAVGWQ